MPERVILVAIDGLDWTRLRQGIAGGYLPNLAKVVADGACAEVPVRSAVPGLCWTETDLNSPTLWTTVASGQYYFQHGISDFRDIAESAENPPLVETRHVRSPRIWDVLSHFGLSSLVVGYYVTHPAYPIRGVMVSDLFGEVESADVVTPSDWHDPLAQLLGARNYAEYAGTGERFAKHTNVLSPEAQLVNHDMSDKRVADVLAEFTCLSDHEIDDLLKSEKLLSDRHMLEYRLVYPVVRDTRFHQIFVELMKQVEWSFGTIYYRLIDFVSHGFWCDEADRNTEYGRRFGAVVDRAYAWMDRRVGELLASLDDGDRVMIMSDHGFCGVNRASGTSQSESKSEASRGEHAEPAVLLVQGSTRSGTVGEVSLMDVAPTILDFFGIPQAESLDGGVVPELLARDTPRKLDRVSAYPYVPPVGQANLSAQEEQLILNRLAALGYIE